MEIRKQDLPQSSTLPRAHFDYASGPAKWIHQAAVVSKGGQVSLHEYITTASRVEQERSGCIRTYTGRYVNPLALRARDICIEDIAHHLANLCRYTGACPQFYSVAQHSFLVGNRLLYQGSHRMALAGLLHDAGEAYFNDIASPVKHDPRMKWYRDLEHETTRMIFCVFGLDPDLLPLTKGADDAVFQDEAATWWGGADLIRPQEPDRAEGCFLQMFHHLMESAR